MPFKLPSYNDLNNTQKTIINQLNSEKFDKLAVIGGPGTGKTIIALQAVAMLAQTGKKCAFLMYNKHLKKFVKDAAKVAEIDVKNIEIETYLSWFWNKIKTMGISDPKLLQSQNFVYNIEELERQFQLFDPNKIEEETYDYIFVDEAQDVQDGLIKYFAKFARKILVTFDDLQKIGNEYSENDTDEKYEHSNILVDLEMGDRFFDLIENYRNSVQNEMVAKLFQTSYETNDMTLKKVTSNRHSQKARIVHTEKTGRDAVQLFADFVLERYDKSRSVGVFINTFDDNCKEYYDVFDGKFKEFCQQKNCNYIYKKNGKVENVTSTKTNMVGNALFLLSSKSCKGLEFDDVYILTSGCTLKNFEDRNLMYVNCTRAKDRINFLVINAEDTNEINILLEKNQLIFETYDLDAEEDNLL